MSHSKLKFGISLVVFTGVAFLLASCEWGSGTPSTSPTPGTSSSEGKIGGLNLRYYNKFTAALESNAEQIKVEFSGKRKLGPGESEAKEDSFQVSGGGDTKSGAGAIATFLNTGEWEVSIKDANVWLKCPQLITVKSTPSNQVTFNWNASNQFENCETLY